MTFTPRDRSATQRDRAAVTWMLKTQGDINENGKGGNASRTLLDRLNDHGYPILMGRLSPCLGRLEREGMISRVTKGPKCYVIRLKKTVGENPWVDTDTQQPYSADIVPMQTALPVPSTTGGFSPEMIAQMPLNERLELIKALSASVQDGFAQLKAAL